MIEIGIVEQATSACSLNDDDLVVRTEEWRRIAARAVSRRTEKGRVVTSYPKDERLLDDLRRLIAAEAECCPSLRFTVDERLDQVVVELRIPPE